MTCHPTPPESSYVAHLSGAEAYANSRRFGGSLRLSDVSVVTLDRHGNAKRPVLDRTGKFVTQRNLLFSHSCTGRAHAQAILR